MTKKMTLNELGTKLDRQGTRIDTLGEKIDSLTTTVDTRGEKLDAVATNLEALTTTVDTLAIMVQKGFEETAKKSDFIVTREELHELIERVGRLEQRVEYGFDMVAQEFKEVSSQLKNIDFLGADVFDLQLRMDKVEKRLKEK